MLDQLPEEVRKAIQSMIDEKANMKFAKMKEDFDTQ